MIKYANFLGDVNIGFYGVVNKNVCLLGRDVEKKNVKKIKETLGVEVEKIEVANTSLVGLFLVMNSNGIIAPNILGEEAKKLARIAKKYDMNLAIIKSKHTALANLILCNDKGALVSKLLTKKQLKTIEDVLGIEASYGTVANLKIVGSCGIANNKGALLHTDATEKESKAVKEVLKVKVDVASINFGSPYLRAGILANDKGALVGEKTTGPEIARISEILQL